MKSAARPRLTPSRSRQLLIPFCFLGSSILVSCAQPNQVAKPKVHVHVRHINNAELYDALRKGTMAIEPQRMVASTGLSLTQQAAGIVDMHNDPATGNWRWVTFDTTRQTTLPLETSLVDWSRSYIAQRAQEFGIREGELANFDNTVYEPFPDHVYVTFQRRFQDIAVKSAFVQLVFSKGADGYRLREVNNNSLGPIELTLDRENLSPPLDLNEIPGLQGWQLGSSRPVIQPRLNAEGKYEFTQAVEYLVKDPMTQEEIKLTRSSLDGRLLEAISSRFHVAHTLRAETFRTSYILRDQLTVTPLSFAQVGNGVRTDANGMFDAIAPTVNVTFSNQFGNVFDASQNLNNNVPYSFQLTLANGPTTTLNAANVDHAALHVFVGVQEINAFAARFITPQQAPILAQPLRLVVNTMDTQPGAQFCNAFFLSTNLSLNFFRQGTNNAGGQAITCPNTALIKDVVYHEWGHALDFSVGIQPGITDGAFSEGIGDITAVLYTGDSVVGRGFVLNDPNSMVRNTENRAMFPPPQAQAGLVHTVGQIIGGAFWDLRQNMVTLYGVEEGTRRTADLFFKHLLVTDRYVDSYQSILRLDDNDNNPATPSPHYCLINKAFAEHGLTGTTREPESCTLADSGLKVRVDADLGQGELMLYASSPGAFSIAMCEGQNVLCKPDSAGYQEFQSIEPKANLLQGPRRFYQIGAVERQLATRVKPAQTYSLVSRNKDGTIIGTRTIRFRARDTSQDLSNTLR